MMDTDFLLLIQMILPPLLVVRQLGVERGAARKKRKRGDEQGQSAGGYDSLGTIQKALSLFPSRSLKYAP